MYFHLSLDKQSFHEPKANVSNETSHDDYRDVQTDSLLCAFRVFHNSNILE